MTPRLRPTLPLRFAEDQLPTDFERLCCDLAAKEPHIDAAALYGRLPQGQKGVDILMYHRVGGGSDVAQCKNYRRFTKADLRTTVKEFEAAQKHWRNKGIRRFLLCLGCTSSDTPLQDEILGQRQRLARRGIAFDVWDDAVLTAKLTTDPALTFRYFGQTIVDQICPSVAGLAGVGKASVNLVQATLEECGSEFDQTLEKELPRLRELARCGHIGEAFAAIQELRVSPRWPLLDAPRRARALQLAASLHLDFKDDVGAARQLIAEGARLAPGESFQVVEAAIALRESGVPAALRILDPPHDLNAWNIRLALQVEAGKWAEVIAAVERAEFSPNGGSYRLASIAALLLRDLVKAQTLSDLAVATSPTWFQVRFQAARMSYVCTLLPHFPMLTHIAWPIPPELEYVRRDAESVARLRAAAIEFAALAQFDSNERRALETWHLACLANLPDGREEAARLAVELLARTPDHLPVAVWCLQRNFPAEKNALLRALSPSEKPPTPDTAQAICQLHIQSGDFASAVAQIESARAVFVAAGVEFAWRHMRSQLAAALDCMDEARRFIAEEPDAQHRREMEIAVARVQARRSGELAPLARVADEAYAATQQPEYLMEAVEAALETGEVLYVVEKADKLLLHFPTAAALTIVLRGAFMAGRFELCLRWLRTHRAFFADGAVPMWVRRTEVECLWQVGNLTAAVAHAQVLVQESADTENLFALFAAQVAFADFRASAQTARQLMARADVSASGLLHLARTIYIEDVALARDGLKAAIQRGLVGNEIAAAVHLGFQIGVEPMIAPLMRDFCALAQQPGAAVKALSFPEIRDVVRNHAQHRDHVWRVFGEGQAPVHLVAKALNIPLAVLLHEQPRLAREAEQPWRDAPTLIRSGSRPPLAEPTVGASELFTDVTALLLAADLELLDLVEKTFAPILISAHLLDSLRRQIDGVAPHQPSRKIPRDEVLRLVQKKRIHAAAYPEAPAELLSRYAGELGEHWCAALARVQTGDAWLCDFTPPQTFAGLPAALAPEHVRRLVSGADVVCALHRAGAISEEEREQMLTRLGEAQSLFQSELTLTPDSTLVLDSGLAEVLAEAGALEAAANFLNVEMSEEEVARLRGENEGHAQRVSLVEWLKTLTERVQRGLTTDIYRNIPRAETTAESATEAPEERCLRDLLAAKASGAKAVWCDDRYLSRYDNVDGLPNYGIIEILRVLRGGGQLSIAGYFDVLLRLRASNARYLPLEKDELLHHLLRAPITAHGLQETPALVVLRRYAAACALDRFRLHPPVKDEHGQPVIAEFMLAVENQRAVAYALAGLWVKTALAENDRFTRAEWLLDQVLAPMSGFIEAHSGLPQPNMADGIAAELAVLFAAGFSLPCPPKFSRDRSHPRAQFYRWLGERLFDPVQRVEPAIVEKLSEHLVRDFFKRDRRLSGKNERGMRLITIRWLLDLPDAVTSALRIPEAARNWFGIRRGIWKLTVFGRVFEGDPFWRAVVSAVDGTATAVRAEDDAEYQLHPPLPGQPSYRVPVSGPGLGPRTRLVEPILLALTGAPARRRAFLTRRLDWFDMSAEKLRPLSQKISRTKDPAGCVTLIDGARSESAEHFYRELLRQLRRDEPGNTDKHLPPSAEMLCRHLRLREEPDFAARAVRLIREVGLAWTIERFAALPITLPPPILQAVTASSTVQRRALLARLRRRLRAPLGRLHLAHLLAHLAGEEPTHLDEAKATVAALLDLGPAREQWKTFRVLLEWTRRFFLSLHDFRQLDASTLLTLTWLHAGRLHQTLVFGRADDARVRDAFARAMDAFGMVPDHSRTAFWQDAAHPRRAGRLPVLLRGLGAALSTLPEVVAAAMREQILVSLATAERFTSSTALLLRETSGLPNALCSFLGGDGHALLGRAFESATLATMLPQSPAEMLSTALAELTVTPENFDAWRTLIFSAADHPLPPDLAAALERFLAGLDLTTFQRLLRDKEDKLLPFLAVRCALSPVSSLRDLCEEHLLTLARQSARSTLDEKALHERVGLLAGSLMLVAVVPGDEATTHERMHKLIVRLLQAWPATARPLRRRFDGWPTHLPLTRQRGFWELEMTLRALR